MNVFQIMIVTHILQNIWVEPYRIAVSKQFSLIKITIP